MSKAAFVIAILGALLVPVLIAATIVPGTSASDDDHGGMIMTFPGFSASPVSIFGKDSALDFQLELNGTWATVSSVTPDTEDDVFNVFDEPFSFSTGTVTSVQLRDTRSLLHDFQNQTLQVVRFRHGQ